MVSRIRQFLAAPVFEEDEDKTRVAGLLNTVLLAVIAIVVMVGIVTAITRSEPVPVLVVIGIVVLLGLGGLFLMRSGRVQLTSVLLSLAVWVILTFVALAGGGVRTPGFSSYISIILIAGLLLGGRTGIAFAGLSAIAGLGILYAEINGLLPEPLMPPTSVSTWAGLTANFVAAAVLLYLATRSLNEALERASRYAAELEEQREHLEETVEERTRDLARRAHYLEATSNVARDAASVLDPQKLLSRVVALVSERFGFDHTGIFLLDATGEWAVLKAASSEGGQRMLARGHRLRVGEEGIVGYVTGRGEPRVALDVGADAMFLDNPDFPHTRSEVALPLRVRGEIIGALDVQSQESEAFSDEDVAVLQTLADQVATAISNARLHDQAQQEIAERKRAEEALERRNSELATLYEGTIAISSDLSLDVVLQAVAEQMTQALDSSGCALSLWDREQNLLETLVDYSTDHPDQTDSAGITYDVANYPVTRRVLETGQPIVIRHDDPAADEAELALMKRREAQVLLMLPLIAHDRVVGLIELVDNTGAREYTPEQIRLAESIAAQAAIAIENARLHEEIEERQVYLEGVLGAAPDAIVTFDTHQRVVEWNPGAERLFGYSRGEAIGENIDRLVTNPDVLEEAVGFTQTVIGGGKIPTTQTVRYRKDGSPVDVIVAGSPLLVRDELMGVVAVYTDITERKRAEEALKGYSERLEEMVEERTQELRDAQEQLIRQGELAVLGQLAGGVSHELRNPLAAIKNAAYFLNMVLEEPDPEVKETLEILNKEVAASERTISSLLDYARTRRPTWRKVDIKGVLDEALSRARVPDNIEVVSQSDGRLPIILADPGQLVQAFGNIIRNAVQAMSEGGRLVVKSEAPSPEWIAVSFADTGVGIPEENLGKLFQPLFTTKAKGIGLGMAVTKTLVEGHGGTVEVESEVGKGTTFRVKLPISAG